MTADIAAQALGLSQHQYTVTIRRAGRRRQPRDGSGAQPVGGGKGKGACREQVRKRVITSYKSGFPDQAEAQYKHFHREVTPGVQAQKLRVPARNTM